MIDAGTCHVPETCQHLFGSGVFVMTTRRMVTHCVHSSPTCRVWTRALFVTSPLMQTWYLRETDLNPTQLLIVSDILDPARQRSTFDLATRQWVGDMRPKDQATEHIPNMIPAILASVTYPVLMYAAHLLRQQAFVTRIAPVINLLTKAVSWSRNLIQSLVFPFLQDASIEWAADTKDSVKMQLEHAQHLLDSFRCPGAGHAISLLYEAFDMDILTLNLALGTNPQAQDALPEVSCAHLISQFLNRMDPTRLDVALQTVLAELESFVRNPNMRPFAGGPVYWIDLFRACLVSGTNLEAVTQLFLELCVARECGMNLFATKKTIHTLKGILLENSADNRTIWEDVMTHLYNLDPHFFALCNISRDALNTLLNTRSTKASK